MTPARLAELLAIDQAVAQGRLRHCPPGMASNLEINLALRNLEGLMPSYGPTGVPKRLNVSAVSAIGSRKYTTHDE